LLSLGVATAVLLLEIASLRANLPGYAPVLRHAPTPLSLWLQYAAVFAVCGLFAPLALRAFARRRSWDAVAALISLALPAALYRATLGYPLSHWLGVPQTPLGWLVVLAVASAFVAALSTALRGSGRAQRLGTAALVVALLTLYGVMQLGSGRALEGPRTVARELAMLPRTILFACAVALPLAAALWRAHERRVGRALAQALVALCALLFLAVAFDSRALTRDAEPARGSRRPPLLLIVADTLRADFVSSLGGVAGTTPHIDALARDGVVFENAPSFASILTSTYPAEHRAGQSRPGRLSRRGIDRSIETLAEVLAAWRYVNAAVLSNAFLAWHYRLGKGFHRYSNVRAVEWYHPVASALHNRVLPWFRRRYLKAYLTAEQQTPRILEALDGLRATGRPWFLLAHYMDAHQPYIAPRRFRESGDATVRDDYRAEVRHLDHYVGALLAELRARGDYDRALIVFTSDHGEELLESRGGEPAAPRHGHTLFDELLRVPLIVKLPGSRLAGTRRTDPVSLVDVAPTILGALGIAAPSGFRGVDLLQAGPPAGDAAPRLLFAETILYGPQQRAALHGETKLILRSESDQAEAYDLAADPLERDPQRVALDAERFAPLLRALRARERGRSAPGEASGRALDPLERQQLEALGYGS
jgi:arylsulfatase A-like enzyme